MNIEEYRRSKEKYINRLENSKSSGLKFTSVSGEDVKPLYTPDDVKWISW